MYFHTLTFIASFSILSRRVARIECMIGPPRNKHWAHKSTLSEKKTEIRSSDVYFIIIAIVKTVLLLSSAVYIFLLM